MRKNTTAKNTFWNRIRADKGVSLKTLSADLNMDQAILSHYFTGMTLPPTSVSVKVCDYFGVDYAVGAAEFNKAHEEWVAENPGAKKKRSHIRSRRYDVKNISADESKLQVMKTTISDKEYFPPVTECIAKESTLTESTIFSMKRDTILRCIYGEVDYDVYNKVVNIFDS